MNQISTYQIKQAVADYFHCRASELDKPTRKREVVIKRQIAHYLARENQTGSLSQIGKQIGNRDHASVLNSFKTINNLLDTNYKLDGIRIDRIIKDIEALINDELSLEHTTDYSGNSYCWFLFC